MGDLSENADYHKAKEDQGFLEGRIQEIEYVLRNFVLIEKNVNRDFVSVGNHVTIQEGDSPPEKYHVVGAKEADPRNGRISNESPIGRALMDHKIGDEVEADTPGGKIKLKIIKIE
jgi:transcription elongation factor GreA